MAHSPDIPEAPEAASRPEAAVPGGAAARSAGQAPISRRAFSAVGGAAVGAAAMEGLARRARAGWLSDVFAQAVADQGAGGEGSDDPQAQASSAQASQQAVKAQAQAQASSRPQAFASQASASSGVAQASVSDMPWAADLSNVANLDYYYLTDAQRAVLAQTGFVQSLGSGFEFFELYESNRYDLVPNFVTVDSMAHTYHLYFSYLLRNLERSVLEPRLADLASRMLAVSLQQLDDLVGTEWESPASVCVSFLAVAAELLDPSLAELAQVPSSLKPTVDAEVSLVQDAPGIQPSPLFGGDEDYSQYAPRGYYAGDAALEAYFRAMMWLGRRNFKQSDELLDRCALLLTLGLAGPDAETAAAWEAIYQVTSFFAGASDDNGYYEYLPLARQAYGEGVSASDLPGDTEGWQRFHELTAQAEAPQINSVPLKDAGEDVDRLAENKGFRFMGQRFSVDAAIFQNLIYSKVGERSDGARRMLPDTLDVPAALGSENAHAVLESQGDTSYPGYEENLAELREAYADESAPLWQASLSARWLAMLRPLLAERGAGWPNAMQGDAWARRKLQTFAGSYAELKHDTVLYAKQAMAEAGGGPIEDRDDRGYVEPEPEVLGRLAALVQATSEGLESFGMLGDEDAQNLEILRQLSEQLKAIAEKELREETPTDEEFDLIRTVGAQLEHFWETVHRQDTDYQYFMTLQFPAAIVTDVATDPNGSVLEIGTGEISTLYVIVPVAGQLRVCSGPVYSFYQFSQPLSERLTDQAWRAMLGIGSSADGSYIDYDTARANRANVVSWVADFTRSWGDA